MMKTIVTATELYNFFWLRNDVAADPTLQELARCMKEAYDSSKPRVLSEDHWHLPYVNSRYYGLTGERIFDINGEDLTIEDAIKVSAARCAAVSFRNEDYGLEKCREVYDRLVGDERKHASALEHQARPIKEMDNVPKGSNYPTEMINVPEWAESWEPGVSHSDRSGQLWSGNFKGWIQYRKLISGENHDEPT